jgi:hypothetical protein
MRFPIYEYLYQLNRNLHETAEILQHIRKSPGINKKQFRAYQVEIEHLRAEASQHVADSMEQIEAKESLQLWKQKRAYEKSLGDPDDVYFEVRNREEERRKQGLPSLIGVLRGHIRKPSDEEMDEKEDEGIDQGFNEEIDEEPEKTASHVSRPTRKVRQQSRKSKRSGRSTQKKNKEQRDDRQERNSRNHDIGVAFHRKSSGHACRGICGGKLDAVRAAAARRRCRNHGGRLLPAALRRQARVRHRMRPKDRRNPHLGAAGKTSRPERTAMKDWPQSYRGRVKDDWPVIAPVQRGTPMACPHSLL